MTVMKAVVRGILIASVVTTPTRAGSMLYLGVNSSTGDSSLASTTPISSSSAPELRLGVTSDVNSLNFAPSSMAASSSPPVATNSSPSQPGVTSSPSSFSTTSSSPSSSPTYDAFINLGSGPYPNSGSLTTGNPQSWYLSSSVDRLFGGMPNLQQQTAFDNTVLQRVQQTFALSGVPVSLTDDPNAKAAHTLSVVSETTNPTLPNALGMTYLGGNGFHYIENSANAAHSVDQLEWIVAHNLAHELMLAFNVPENYDKTGQFIDARDASWSMITNPDSTFSPAAVTALLSQNFQATNSSVLYPSAQLLGPSPVPEPATWAIWTLIAGCGMVVGRIRVRAIPARS
jgi:hypothetical protein